MKMKIMRTLPDGFELTHPATMAVPCAMYRGTMDGTEYVAYHIFTSSRGWEYQLIEAGERR